MCHRQRCRNKPYPRLTLKIIVTLAAADRDIVTTRPNEFIAVARVYADVVAVVVGDCICFVRALDFFAILVILNFSHKTFLLPEI